MLQYYPERPPQQHDIQPYAPVADVPGVHLDPFFVGGVAAAVHLPHAGDAGMDHIEVLDVGSVFGNLRRDDGPGPHQAHLADEHVEQLGQFVQAGFPQHFPHPGHPGIILQLEFRFPFFPGFRIGRQVFFQFLIRIHAHGPELQTGKQLAPLADPLVGENHRAPGIQLDQDGQQQENGAQEDHANGGQHQVKDPFDKPVVGPGQVVLQAHEHQPFVEQGIHFDAVHRQTDQIRDKGQVPHMGLDHMDQLVQFFRSHPGHSNAHILDLGLFDDLHHLAKGAQIGQVSHVFFLRTGVIHITDYIEIETDVVPDALEHQTGRFSGPHQEHRNTPHPSPVQHMGEEVPEQGHQDNRKDPEESHEKPGGAGRNMGQVHKDHNGPGRIGTGPENGFQQLPVPKMLGVDAPLAEKQQEKQWKGHPEVQPGHVEMGIPGNSPPQVVRQEFRQQDHHPVGDGIDGGQEIIQVMMDEGIGIGFRKGRMGHKEAPFAQQNGYLDIISILP